MLLRLELVPVTSKVKDKAGVKDEVPCWINSRQNHVHGCILSAVADHIKGSSIPTTLVESTSGHAIEDVEDVSSAISQSEKHPIGLGEGKIS